MNLEDFNRRHGLSEIPVGSPIPQPITPHEGDAEDSFRFFVNDARTLGLGLNETKDDVRIVFAELGLADTGWIPIADVGRRRRRHATPEAQNVVGVT